MIPNKRGLIVNISSAGGMKYLFNVAYGVGKAGCDRMAADCAYELKKQNVAMVSLWPGPVKTEFIQENVIDTGCKFFPQFQFIHTSFNLVMPTSGYFESTARNSMVIHIFKIIVKKPILYAENQQVQF